MTRRERANAIGYGRAVANALTAAGIENRGAARAEEPGRLKRALTISLLNRYWDADSVQLDLEWDEERGWALLDVFEPGAVRGFAYASYDLGLGVLPEPAEVARLVNAALEREEHLDIGPRRKYRMAVKHNPDFEAALAAYRSEAPT